MIHKPVLVQEVLAHLQVKPGDNIVDCTIGQGGHAAELLKLNAPNGKLLGIDADPKQIESARRNLAQFSERVVLTNDSYANLSQIIEKHHFRPVHGMVLDLGYSSWHVDESGKGFSFQKDEPLDMRYGNQGVTAAALVNEWPEKELEKIFAEYGEEKFSRQIANFIVRQRKVKKIETTGNLAAVIGQAIPEKFKHGKIHYATRTFQALRIAVNHELENLRSALPQAMEVLASGSRLAVISFHSLEDRMVKQFFKEQERLGSLEIITKKPIVAGEGEVLENPRARSAKLRAIIKT